VKEADAPLLADIIEIVGESGKDVDKNKEEKIDDGRP